MLHSLELNKSAVFEMLAGVAAQTYDAPRALGDKAYTSQELFELELETIFKNQWVCVGRVDEFKRPGDYVALHNGKVPILVVKQASGEIEALLNSCSHRMAPVGQGRGNLPRFVCPYHAWTYDRSGALIAAPRMPPEMDKAACNLPKFAVETWMGFVYVNPDRNATSLNAQLAPLRERFKPYPLPRMRTMRHAAAEWKCNWKIAVENFLESYHFPAVHPKTLGGFLPTDTLKMSLKGDLFAFHEITLPEGAITHPQGSLLMDNPDITPEQERVIYTGGVFPNHVFTVQYDQIAWIRMQPLAVDRTLIDFGIAGAFNIPEGVPPDPSHPEFVFLQLADMINAEDQVVTEAIQANAGSGLGRPHLLHPSEHGLLSFARYLERQLRGA
jgi:choline monooxygenase